MFKGIANPHHPHLGTPCDSARRMFRQQLFHATGQAGGVPSSPLEGEEVHRLR